MFTYKLILLVYIPGLIRGQFGAGPNFGTPNLAVDPRLAGNPNFGVNPRFVGNPNFVRNPNIGNNPNFGGKTNFGVNPNFVPNPVPIAEPEETESKQSFKEKLENAKDEIEDKISVIERKLGEKLPPVLRSRYKKDLEKKKYLVNKIDHILFGKKLLLTKEQREQLEIQREKERKERQEKDKKKKESKDEEEDE